MSMVIMLLNFPWYYCVSNIGYVFKDLFLFYVFMFMSICIHDCACLVPSEAIREFLDWTDRQLQGAARVLGMEPRSSTRATNAFRLLSHPSSPVAQYFYKPLHKMSNHSF